jgi:hypothetical protein
MSPETKPAQRRTVVWGHLVLLAFIVAVVVAYLLDARGTSLKLNNLLLVQPAAIVALILAALVLLQVFPRVSVEAKEDAVQRRLKRLELARVAMLATAFGLFVFSLEKVGFDVAIFIFVAIGLYICGERKLWVIALYSILFTLVVVYGYQKLVPYPFPLTVL